MRMSKIISSSMVLFVCLVVLDATFNNISAISWRLFLLVDETGVPGQNHRPVASHWQTLSHNVVSSTPHYECGYWTHTVSGDRHWLHRFVVNLTTIRSRPLRPPLLEWYGISWFRTPIGTNQKLWHLYVMLLCEASRVKETEQRLVGSETG